MMSQNIWEGNRKYQRRNEEGMKETIPKIYIIKSWLFGKINEIEKPLAKVIKEKEEGQNQQN